jgi:hypothetical protein
MLEHTIYCTNAQYVYAMDCTAFLMKVAWMCARLAAPPESSAQMHQGGITCVIPP